MTQTISNLVASMRKPERINIFVDGEFALQVHIDVIGKFGVRKGRVWDADLQDKLRADKRGMKVRALALAYATYKPRSTAQVRTRLSQKECTPEEIESAIDFLEEFGYLNDEAFAAMYIRDRLLIKAVSARGLQTELRKRGVPAELAEKVIQEHYPFDQHEDLARKAALKKLKAVSYRPKDKQQKSVSEYLMRQGFQWSLIRSIVAELFNENSRDLDESYGSSNDDM